MNFRLFVLIMLASFECFGQDALNTEKQISPAMSDQSPHRVLFVSVDKDVKVEVLDWGGPVNG